MDNNIKHNLQQPIINKIKHKPWKRCRNNKTQALTTIINTFKNMIDNLKLDIIQKILMFN